MLVGTAAFSTGQATQWWWWVMFVGPHLVVNAFVEKVLHLRKLQVAKINTVLLQARLPEVICLETRVIRAWHDMLWSLVILSVVWLCTLNFYRRNLSKVYIFFTSKLTCLCVKIRWCVFCFKFWIVWNLVQVLMHCCCGVLVYCISGFVRCRCGQLLSVCVGL